MFFSSQVIDSLLHIKIETDDEKQAIKDAFNNFYRNLDKISDNNYGIWLDSLYSWGKLIQKNQADLTINLLLPIHQNEYVYQLDSLNVISGKILNLLAVVLRRTGEEDMALEVYSQAITYFQKCNNIDPLILPAIYNNIGNAFKDMGDLSKALYYSSEGVRNCESHLNDSDLSINQEESISQNLVKSLMNLGLIKAKMLRYDAAVLHFAKAMELAPTYYPDIIHKIQNNLGISLAKLNRYEESRECYLAAIMQAGKMNDKVLLAQYQLNFSSFLQKYQPEEFSDYLPLVIKSVQCLSGSIQKQEFLSLILVQESYYYEALGEYPTAISKLIQAFQTLQGMRDPILSWNQIPKLQITVRPYIALGIVNDQARIIKKLALEENKQEYLTQALDHYIFAERLIDSLRGNLTTQESKIILNQQQKRTFRSKADLCGELYQSTGQAYYLTELFSTCEKGKTAGLWSEIQQADLKTGYIPKELLDHEANLKKDIVQINDRIASFSLTGNAPIEEEISLLRDQKIILTTSLDSLLQIYNKSYPEYYNLKFSNNTTDLTDLQSELNLDQVFLQFYFTDNFLHQILVLQDTVIYNPIQDPQKILNNVETILTYNRMMRPDYSRIDVEQYVNAAYSVYHSLFGAIIHLAKGKKLIIAPDSKLSLLPFEALVQSGDYQYETDFRDLDYLIYTHELTYTYTATLWSTTLSRHKSKKTNRKILAFAPYYEDDKINEQYDKYFGESLPVLPGTLDELKHIQKLFKSDIYTRDAATEKRFKSKIQKAEIVHLAMHTITNDEEPLQTSLIFNPFTDQLEDGRLTAAEILNYRINASLVVLSACNTGSGKLREGEGIMGLARSFIQAGCPGLILNLWIMDDISGKKLINSFYSFLADGESTSSALHKAKLTHLQSANKLNAHPHFWAGLILSGKDAEISIHRRSLLSWPIYLAFGLLFMTFVFWKKNKGPRKHRDL
ncbi:MAG: CHAT domain-containing tetratricopeptide repeat protein [Bacteroidota bacterium]|nr:CHAT domain-containing tetratricopeptide repeat protein [Bacteroidota bacterium]